MTSGCVQEGSDTGSGTGTVRQRGVSGGTSGDGSRVGTPLEWRVRIGLPRVGRSVGIEWRGGDLTRPRKTTHLGVRYHGPGTSVSLPWWVSTYTSPTYRRSSEKSGSPTPVSFWFSLWSGVPRVVRRRGGQVPLLVPPVVVRGPLRRPPSSVLPGRSLPRPSGSPVTTRSQRDSPTGG